MTSRSGLTISSLFAETKPVYGPFGASFPVPYGGSSRAQNSRGDLASLGFKAQKFVAEAKVRSEYLKLSLINLTGNNKTPSVFERTTAVSSDPSALKIKSFEGDKNNFTGMYVKIDRVAATQRNAGHPLLADEKNFTAGRNAIEIESNGKKTPVSFTISAKDDNKTAQRKMASAINNKKAGVTASVSYDAKTKKSALTAESLTTGADETGTKFYFRDLNGDSVEISGIDVKKRDASDAAYSVNGGETRYSGTNTVLLGGGVTAVLKNKTGGEIKISVEPDATAAIVTTRKMAELYNGLLAAAEDNSGDADADVLSKRLRNAARAYKPQLKNAGIEITDGGYMVIDEKDWARRPTTAGLVNCSIKKTARVSARACCRPRTSIKSRASGRRSILRYDAGTRRSRPPRIIRAAFHFRGFQSLLCTARKNPGTRRTCPGRLYQTRLPQSVQAAAVSPRANRFS